MRGDFDGADAPVTADGGATERGHLNVVGARCTTLGSHRPQAIQQRLRQTHLLDRGYVNGRAQRFQFFDT